MRMDAVINLELSQRQSASAVCQLFKSCPAIKIADKNFLVIFPPRKNGRKII